MKIDINIIKCTIFQLIELQMNHIVMPISAENNYKNKDISIR